MTAEWRDDYQSWGRAIGARHLVSRPRTMDEAAALVAAADALPILGYGCGRSYGDVPLNPEGRLIDCLALDRLIAFDARAGILTCEGGVRLADILAILCKPDADGGGWFPPVAPGTRFVTVGGAIANDVHGKNHHLFGTFGHNVLSFDLARSDGSRLTCSRERNQPLFEATIGGLGLTGLILCATIQLRRAPGLAFETEDLRFDSLAEFFAIAVESDAHWEYSTAWIDSMAGGSRLGRGVYSRARHAPGVARDPPGRRPAITFPVTPPVSLVNPLTVRAFNALYWRRLGPMRTRRRRVGGYEKLLFPLDGLGRWNRVYGPRGFHQFQCVVPTATAIDAISEMLRVIAASGQGSMLTGLKMFGERLSAGLMSFPMPGATLAIDFPNRGRSTDRLLETLERLAIEAGGRLYPAKDGRMTAGGLRAGYPNLERYRTFIDPGFSSAFAQRVNLVSRGDPAAVTLPPVAGDTMTVGIFGATSDIAAAVCQRLAARRCRLVLVGRDAQALSIMAADLESRGAAAVVVQEADFARLDELAAVAARAWDRFGHLDVALVAYGAMPDQVAAEQSAAAAESVLRLNFVSPVLLLNELARRFEQRGGGVMAAISSVAGDRGRKSNHIYGAAKGGLHRYLEGLRHRLHGARVSVLDIRPGFVRTKMTDHLDRRGPLWTSPDRVAADIVRAIDRRRAVLYTPWFWRGVMAIVRNAPRAIFHRTSL